LKKGDREWKMSEMKLHFAMERLVSWVIREISEEGGLVGIQRDVGKGKNKGERRRLEEEWGYLPIVPELMGWILVPVARFEMDIWGKVFKKRSEKNDGVGLEDLTKGLNKWGEEGRWERVGEWVVKEGMDWGVGDHLFVKMGRGYWLGDGS